ncbi:MAG: efflux RND transporter permease subunit [Spirosomataceae bacterium]
MEKTTVAITLALFAVAVLIFSQLGGEFVPTLDEGDLAIDFRTASGTSLTGTIEAANKAHQILKKHFPEIQQIVGRVGASEIPTDPMPIEMVDQMINMKDISEWTHAKNREEMSEKMAAVLAEELPGTSVEMTQPIQMRFNEMITGVRSDVVVKLLEMTSISSLNAPMQPPKSSKSGRRSQCACGADCGATTNQYCVQSSQSSPIRPPYCRHQPPHSRGFCRRNRWNSL